MSFLDEIKRRKAFQVAAVYAVVMWLVVQIVSTVEEPLSLPAWFDTAIIVLLAVGFPVTLVISWAFDVTPDGLIKDRARQEAPAPGRRTMEIVLLMLLATAAVWIGYRELAPPGRLPNSIAVLPFEALTTEADDAFFAVGIHDTILNELAKIEDLNVIARTSVLQYAGSSVSIAQIAEDLNVATVMEGTVQYADGRVRITAQLINPDTGAHLWSGNYTSDFTDVFNVQSEIAERIAFALEAELLPSERDRLQERSTSSPEAWLLYVRAMEAIGWDIRPNPPQQAIEAFHRYLSEALEIDPNFTLAHAYKSYDYSMSLYRAARLDEQTEQEIRALAGTHLDRAIALDPDLAMVSGARGMAAWSEWRQQSEAASSGFERGLELSPGNRDIRDDLIRLSSRGGRYERARALAEEALLLDPNQAAYWLNRLALVAMDSADVDAATAYAEEALELSASTGPVAEGALRRLAWSAVIRGDNELALDRFSRLETTLKESGVISPYEYSVLAYGYARSGRPEDARRLAREIDALGEEYIIGIGTRALAALAVADVSAMMDYLRLAEETRPVDEGTDALMLIAVDMYDDEVLRAPDVAEMRQRLMSSTGWTETPWR